MFFPTGPRSDPRKNAQGCIWEMEGRWSNITTFYWKSYGRPWEHTFGHQGPRRNSIRKSKGPFGKCYGGGLAPFAFLLKSYGLNRTRLFPNMAQDGSQKNCFRVRLGNGRQVVEDPGHLIGILWDPLGTPFWPSGSQNCFNRVEGVIPKPKKLK